MTTHKIHNWEDRKSQLRRGRKTIRKYRSLDLTSSSEEGDPLKLYIDYQYNETITDKDGNRFIVNQADYPVDAAMHTGQALRFNGVDQWADCGTSPHINFDDPITTIRFYIDKQNGYNGFYAIFGNSTNNYANYDGFTCDGGYGRLGFNLNNGINKKIHVYPNSNTVSNGVHTVVFTANRNTDNFKIYIDGELFYEKTTAWDNYINGDDYHV